MNYSRRRFLKAGLSATAIMALPDILRFAISDAIALDHTEYRAAVCIFLEGGNDGWNSFIPNDDARYSQYMASRGNLAIPRNELNHVTTQLGRDAYGFHPALRGLGRLFEQGKLAVLTNVGTLKSPITRGGYQNKSSQIPAHLFAHNEQRKQWQANYKQGRPVTGWGGLIAETLQTANVGAKFPALASISESSHFCEGSNLQPAIIRTGRPLGLNGFKAQDHEVKRLQGVMDLLSVDHRDPLIKTASINTTNSLRYIENHSQALAELPPLRTTFPNTSIGKRLKEVSNLIQARENFGLSRQIFFVKLEGFDTHSNQLGRQSHLLAQLDAAMSAFYSATEELNVSSQVLTFTASEFGRTLNPANGGSSHAWGNNQFVMGGSVLGGNVYGSFPQLTLGGVDDATSSGVIIPTTAVDQYIATIANWLGVAPGSLPDLFPNLINFQSHTLRFV